MNGPDAPKRTRGLGTDISQLIDRCGHPNGCCEVTTAVGSTVHRILKVDDTYLVETVTREILLEAAYRLVSDDAPAALELLEAARDDDRDVGGGRAVAAIEEIMTEVAEGRATR